MFGKFFIRDIDIDDVDDALLTVSGERRWPSSSDQDPGLITADGYVPLPVVVSMSLVPCIIG